MKMKTLTLSLALTIVASSPAFAGIPVTVVADPQALTNHITELGKMVEQIRQLENQLHQMEREYTSMTGSRGLGGLINSAYDKDVLKDLDLKGIMSQNGLKSSKNYNLDQGVGEVFDLSNKNAAQYSGQATKSLTQAQERFDELKGLVRKVNNSSDPKEVMDLQARIGSEQSFLQNEVAKLQVLEQQAQANEQIRRQLVRQKAIESAGDLRTFDWAN